MGIGDWGLGIGPNPQSPIPNPQSPFNSHYFCIKAIFKKKFYLINEVKNLLKNINNGTSSSTKLGFK